MTRRRRPAPARPRRPTAKVRAMIAPTTRPARISQPTLLRQRSDALANTSPIVKVPPVWSSKTRGTREAIPREFARESLCYPCFRHARLDPQGVPQVGRHGGRRRVAGGHGCGTQPVADPPQRRPPLLPPPPTPGRQADEAGPGGRAREQPGGDHAAAIAALGGIEAFVQKGATSSSSPTSAPTTTVPSTRPPPTPTWSARWSGYASGRRPARARHGFPFGGPAGGLPRERHRGRVKKAGGEMKLMAAANFARYPLPDGLT